ncbi:unnamed protein product [Effrenium voratum]|nr:unnamed protein product [Effrenium voratum]
MAMGAMAEVRKKALLVLSEALEAAAPASHPWAPEFAAWQLEALLLEDLGLHTIGVPNTKSETEKVSVQSWDREYRARLRRLLQGARLEANRARVARLVEGRLAPCEFLRAEACGELLPELQRERLAQDKAAALDRKARELAGERRANALPFFSEKIQCQGCSLWGAFYDRIPHVGGHHKLGKTASLGGTDYARLLAECASCGRRWRTDEPP